MSDKKTDRRVKYTKMVLRESLLEIMKDKSINKITVTELCKQADINRNTFYTHFESPFDLLASIEQSFSEKFIETVEQTLSAEQYDGLMYKLCSYIQENRQLCTILISNHGNGDYLKRIILYFKDRITENWSTRTNHDDQYHLTLLYNFVSSGSAAIIEEWVNNDFRQSAKDIAQFIDQVLFALHREFQLDA